VNHVWVLTAGAPWDVLCVRRYECHTRCLQCGGDIEAGEKMRGILPRVQRQPAEDAGGLPLASGRVK
jgi:hypothetical protein